MFFKILLSAVFAALAAGIIVSAVQQVTTTPLILIAETYEDGSASATHSGTELPASGPAGSVSDTSEPQTGSISRSVMTAVANIVLAFGFSLALLSVQIMLNRNISVRTGLFWGIAAFAAFHLAPALGLPPELPGSAAGELVSRQIWWAATAILTALGIALLVYRQTFWVIAAAALLFALPHLYGAPQPQQYASTVPAEVAAHFAASSLVIMAVFWTMIGSLSGFFFARQIA
uniref:CbtA family protein n=1 Tax=Pararhizobium sp. IMCC3301 TaxID=3067904 RepID=UPI002740ECBB|nr:CbtA family protein [Pararhizobium sp. IMCC3301]